MSPVSPRVDESGFTRRPTALPIPGRYRCTPIVNHRPPDLAAAVEVAGRRPCPETVRAGAAWQSACGRDREPGTFIRAPRGTWQASGSGGRWAVKIASRLSMRLPVGCTLAACLTGDRPCVGGLGWPLVVGSPVAAGGPRLIVRLRDEGEPADVGARDRIRPGQPLLGALGHRPVLDRGLPLHPHRAGSHPMQWPNLRGR
jgi:hypothetical protein